MYVEVMFDTGYGFIPRTVMTNPELSIEAKAIFAYMASYSGVKGECFPSVDTIVKQLGISKDRYYRHMKLLRESGYITVEQTKCEDSKFRHNIYRLHPCPQNTYTGNANTENANTCHKDTKSNINKNNNNNNKEKASKDDIPYQEIIDYLNEKTGKRFKAVDSNKKLIRARWREKYTLEDFKKVIDVKVEKWLGNDMEEYLRPKTLFASSHFDDYLNEAEKKFKKQEGISNPNGEYIDKGAGEFGDFAEEWARQMNPDNMFGR